MMVFVVVAMLIMCWIINDYTGLEVYAYKQYEIK
jgi:hypothetical protein